MSLQLSERGGLTLALMPDPARADCMIAALSGDELKAQTSVDQKPAQPDRRQLHDFFTAAADVGVWGEVEWRTEGEDLVFQARGAVGFIMLRVLLESTSRGNSEWFVDATLRVSPDDLRRCAHEAAILFAGSS